MNNICCVCKKNIKCNEYVCELCNRPHHLECSGDINDSSGDYSDEYAYSVCEDLINKELLKQIKNNKW